MLPNIDLYFDLNEEEVKEVEEKYALLEPFLDDAVNPAQKRVYRQLVCQRLQISKRTLRRLIQRLKKEGLPALIRKKRSDAGKFRKFSQEVLDKALALLKENPYRGVPTLMRLLSANRELEGKMTTITASTLYFHLKKAGVDFQKKYIDAEPRTFHQFEADYPNQLWQGDARHGIFLPDPKNPKKRKRTYLFAWIDDFSRKVTYARYYWDEKLPRLEDCFRQAVLRWGLPEKLYCDNGSAYISSHFLFVTNDLDVRKIHHPAYSAWCKGKVESMMKRFKQGFQREAQLAGFKTLEELNSALFAWLDVEYHRKKHSTTGETPDDRYANNVNNHPPRRIENLEEFNSLFLWREQRSVTKYGRIPLQTNKYSVKGVAPGSKVEVRFNPFDLSEVQIFFKGRFIGLSKANVLNRVQVKAVPEERDRPEAEVSQASSDYFKKLREQHHGQKLEEADGIRFSDLNEKE